MNAFAYGEVNIYLFLIPTMIYGIYRFLILAFYFKFISLENNVLVIPTLKLFFHLRKINKDEILEVRRIGGDISFVLLRLENENILLKEKYFKQDELEYFLSLISD